MEVRSPFTPVLNIVSLWAGLGADMADFTLTTGNDTVVAPAGGATVYANAATLNPGDSLTGGAGVDTLELVGVGTFDLSGLA